MIGAIHVFHEGGTMFGAGWFVDEITVSYTLAADEKEGREYDMQVTDSFAVNAWIENYSWSGRKTTLENPHREMQEVRAGDGGVLATIEYGSPGKAPAGHAKESDARGAAPGAASEPAAILRPGVDIYLQDPGREERARAEASAPERADPEFDIFEMRKRVLERGEKKYFPEMHKNDGTVTTKGSKGMIFRPVAKTKPKQVCDDGIPCPAGERPVTDKLNNALVQLVDEIGWDDHTEKYLACIAKGMDEEFYQYHRSYHTDNMDDLDHTWRRYMQRNVDRLLREEAVGAPAAASAPRVLEEGRGRRMVEAKNLANGDQMVFRGIRREGEGEGKKKKKKKKKKQKQKEPVDENIPPPRVVEVIDTKLEWQLVKQITYVPANFGQCGFGDEYLHEGDTGSKLYCGHETYYYHNTISGESQWGREGTAFDR